ncbi:MAG: hypothetical protein ACR2J8_03670, partial [Thermomicrobiales bacterium]
ARHVMAARLLGAADALLLRGGYTYGGFWDDRIAEMRHTLGKRLGRATLATLERAGSTLTPDDLVARWDDLA